MTRMGDELNREDRIVLVFDMRSSSNIIEDLDNRGMAPYRDMMILLKEWLDEASARFSFEPYKFTGDGWILLFSKDTPGGKMIEFLESLYRSYLDRFHLALEGRLESPPKVAGLTVGIAEGSLVRFQMLGVQEYVGRAINVACRLQTKAKGKGFAPERGSECTVLISNPTYTQCLQANIPNAEERTVNLHNIRLGHSFQCRLHRILPSVAEKTSPVVEALMSKAGKASPVVEALASKIRLPLLPNGIQGVWQNTWRIEGKEDSEPIEFTPDNKGLVREQYTFDIKDIQVDQIARKVRFTKQEVDGARKTLMNELFIVDEDTLAGIEINPDAPNVSIGIRYKRM